MRRSQEQAPLLPVDVCRTAAVVVTVTDPEDVPLPAAEQLSRLFGLTPPKPGSLPRLPVANPSTTTPRGPRSRSGRRLWTLKNVLDKMGCRKQSELVHMIITSIGTLVTGV
jgi:hypothetical protein